MLLPRASVHVSSFFGLADFLWDPRTYTYDTYSTIDFLKVHEQQIIERDSQMFILWDQENENGFLQALKSNKVPKSASYIFRVMQHMATRLVTSV